MDLSGILYNYRSKIRWILSEAFWFKAINASKVVLVSFSRFYAKTTTNVSKSSDFFITFFDAYKT